MKYFEMNENEAQRICSAEREVYSTECLYERRRS